MNRPTRPAALALLAALLVACSSTPDPQDVEGILFDESGIFRRLDLPGAAPADVYEAARRIVRLRFAGGRIVEVPEERRIEVPPRAFRGSPQRVHVYLQVLDVEGGARVEIFAPVDELADDPEELPENPWIFRGRDARLENYLLSEIWDVMMVRPLGAREGLLERR